MLKELRDSRRPARQRYRQHKLAQHRGRYNKTCEACEEFRGNAKAESFSLEAERQMQHLILRKEKN